MRLVVLPGLNRMIAIIGTIRTNRKKGVQES
jgi:hypothetical protein